jgi:hypothetical protein
MDAILTNKTLLVAADGEILIILSLFIFFDESVAKFLGDSRYNRDPSSDLP